MNELSLKERATNFETCMHISKVQHYINLIIKELLERSEKHDQSKLYPPEVGLFAEFTPKLAGCTYGSKEYEEFRKSMGPALEHHYAKNTHHPEHWKNGIRDMDLVDIVEMFCDWKAATLRHNDGNLLKSIENNASRFNISEELVKIFENTARLFE